MYLLTKIRVVLLVLFLSQAAFAQDTTYNKFGKGISIMANDSSFSLKFSTRFQTLYEGTLNTKTDDWSDKFLIRRARLKFDGFVYDPRVKYKIELGLSNRDIGNVVPQTNNTANVILDAVIKYAFAKNWEVWFGQTKLPGNRERVISSQKLQFVDRSLVNSRFNIDRDITLQLHHKGKLGNGIIKQAAAISKGEGRNITVDNIGGYDYTARIEYLPFGNFTGKGDYFGSDLKREEKPKLSIGITYDYNDRAARQRGQLGNFVADDTGNQITNSLSTIFIDAMFKYNGWSIMSEFAHKSAQKDLDADNKYGTGTGFVLQTGYLLDNNFEIAGRFTIIDPDNATFSGLKEETEYTLGISKYFVGHSLKIQSDLAYTDIGNDDNKLRFRFQVELSF